MGCVNEFFSHLRWINESGTYTNDILKSSSVPIKWRVIPFTKWRSRWLKTVDLVISSIFFYEPNLLDTVFQRSNITQVPLAWMNYYHLIRSFFFLCLSISQVGAKFHFLLFCFRKRCHSVEFANNVRLDLFQHIHMHF